MALAYQTRMFAQQGFPFLTEKPGPEVEASQVPVSLLPRQIQGVGPSGGIKMQRHCVCLSHCTALGSSPPATCPQTSAHL